MGVRDLSSATLNKHGIDYYLCLILISIYFHCYCRGNLSMCSNTEVECKVWCPEKILNEGESSAIILLNQPLCKENERFLKQHWNNAVVRIAVDGGVNHLKKIFSEHMLVPEIISGDFDSASPEFLKFFKEKGSSIVFTEDQDETDFTKAVRLVLNYIDTYKHKKKVSSIIAVVRNGDRLDHIFGNLNTLYFAAERSSIPVFILGERAVTWLLTEGSHIIQVPSNMRESNIGLIPLGEECTDITTTGLKWNLTHDKMKFGGLISTSNRFDDDSDEVCITTDTKLIWTMEFSYE